MPDESRKIPLFTIKPENYNLIERLYLAAFYEWKVIIFCKQCHQELLTIRIKKYGSSEVTIDDLNNIPIVKNTIDSRLCSKCHGSEFVYVSEYIKYIYNRDRKIKKVKQKTASPKQEKPQSLDNFLESEPDE